MEEKQKNEMEFPEEGQAKTKREMTSRDMLRIVGLLLGAYFILKGFWAC